MAATKYSYGIAAFTGLNVGRTRPALPAVEESIRNSAILTALDYSSWATSTELCDIWFKDVLSAGDETLLDGLVAAHDGEPLPGPATDDDGNTIVSMSHARYESDGRQVVVPSPATHGWNTWFTGAGDDINPSPPASGRGEGERFRLSFSGPGTDEFEAQFSEPVEMHDGEIFYEGFDMDDVFNFLVKIPATDPASTPGVGNCQAVDMGGYNLYVPAAGDGSHTLDLDDVFSYAPVFTGGDEYWTYDRVTGVCSPADAGDGNCNLLGLPIEVFFMRKIPMGHHLKRFEVDTYKVEWLHPAWKLTLRCTKASAGEGEVAAVIMVFRRGNT